MNIKVDFDNIVVKEDKNDFNVKVLMLKGEKGDQGDGEPNVIETVQVNGTALPITNKTVNVPVPTIDSAISSSSTNPVQNKAIYNALSDKVNTSELNNYYEISEVDALLTKKPYCFENVSEMKAYDLQEGDYVSTKGYYSSGDGGQGEYVIVDDNNLVDDGGSIHELTNRLKAKLISIKVTPEMYGAKGDGETDDLQAFIKMFEATNTQYEFSNKTFLLSEKLNIVNKDNIIIEGNNAIIKLENGSEDSELQTEYGVINFNNCNNLVINNLTINTNANWYMRPHIDWGGDLTPEWEAWLDLRKKTYGGLALWSLKNANITNVKCMNSRTGFYINHCEKVTIEECESNRTFADGIYITNASKYVYVNKHYCENTGDDCYSSDGWENALNDYIYFTDCIAHISGGGLLCANTTNHTSFTNLYGDELNYTPFKYEAFYDDCENIVIDNCVGITNNNMELEFQYGMPVGGRLNREWKVKNVEVRNSIIINKNPTTRRIEWVHQKIEGIKYINCYIENLTPLFTENSKDIYIDNCNFETQDAFSLIDVTNTKIVNSILHNNSYFSNRGNANFYLLRTSNVHIENNKLYVEASSSHDITFTGANSYLTTDTEDINGSNTTLTNFKYLGIMTQGYWINSCVDGQLFSQQNEIQVINNHSYTAYLNNTVTGNGLTCTLKRRGNYVTAYLSGVNINEIPTTGQYDITIPANFRPVADVQHITSTLGGKRYLLSVKTDGRFGVQWASEVLPASQTFFETITWLVV